MLSLTPGRLAFGIVPWYSLIIVSAIALAVYLCGREEKRLGLPKDTAIDSALWAIPLGIIGARLYYVAFAWEQFSSNPIRILYVWEGGVAIYGALLGGLLGVFNHARRKKISLLSILDMIAPSVVLAQAMGRWGNFFNMEAYGEVVANPAWQFFPFAVYIPGTQDGVWHLATFFYESLWDLITFVLLMAYRKRMPRRGDVFLWYLLLYGAGRTVVEGLRLDSLMWLNGTIRVSQWLSLLAMAAVLMVFALRMRKNKGLAVSFAALIAFLLHSFYLIFVGWNGVRSYFWPWLDIAILVGCAIFILKPVVQEKSKKLAVLFPYALVTAAFSVFLLFWHGAQSTLLEQTVFIAFVALSFPAASLAIYPFTCRE